jgi:hypothetical protein
MLLLSSIPAIRRLFSQGALTSTSEIESIIKTVRSQCKKRTGPIPRPNASALGYLPGETYESVLNRGHFWNDFLNVVDARRSFMHDFKGGQLPKGNLKIMGVTGMSGSGKTTGVGMLMDWTEKVNGNDPDRKMAINYMARYLGASRASMLANRMDKYVILPLTFNSRQGWRASEDSRPGHAILSRILHSILQSANFMGKLANREGVGKLMTQSKLSFNRIQGWLSSYGEMTSEDMMTILGSLFAIDSDAEMRFVICVDELVKVEDEKMRKMIITFLGTCMDIFPNTHCLLTSLDFGLLLEGVTPSGRYIAPISLSNTPALLNKRDGYHDVIERQPAAAVHLLPLTIAPRDLIELENTIFSASKESRDFIFDLASGKYLPPSLISFIMKIFKRPNVTDLRSHDSVNIEEFVKMSLEGGMIARDEHVVEIRTENGLVSLTAAKLLEYGLFVHDNLSPYIPKPTVAEFVPTVITPVLLRVLCLHPKIQKGANTAAFFGLAMCLVRPWSHGKYHDGQGLEQLFALNEAMRRMASYHGKDYFGENVDTVEPKIRRLRNIYPHLRTNATVSTYSRHKIVFIDDDGIWSMLIEDLEKIIGETDTASTGQENGIGEVAYFNGQFAKWETSVTSKGNPDAVTRLSDSQLETFVNSGIILMNSTSGPGFDYATVDDGCLTFYEVKFSKLQMSRDGMIGHGRGLDSEMMSSKFKSCKSIFEAASKRLPAIKTWRLIIQSYRDLGASTSAIENDRLLVLGPKDCAAILPPSFSYRLEMVPGTGPEIVDSASELLDRDTVCEQ